MSELRVDIYETHPSPDAPGQGLSRPDASPEAVADVDNGPDECPPGCHDWDDPEDDLWDDSDECPPECHCWGPRGSVTTTTIEHSRIYGTTARLSDHNGWLKATLRQHGFEWSRTLTAFVLPGTRSWPANPYKIEKLTRELDRCGFAFTVTIDDTTPEADPVADALTKACDLAYAAQRLGAALTEDMRSRPLTAEHIKQAQDAVDAAYGQVEQIAERPGVYEQPEMRTVFYLLNQASMAVGLPPF